jgi:hypothetical protein
MTFPTSKTLQCEIYIKCAAPSVDRGAQSACALAELRPKAHARREKLLFKRMRARCASVGWNTRAPMTNGSRKKIRMDFSQFSCELTG